MKLASICWACEACCFISMHLIAKGTPLSSNLVSRLGQFLFNGWSNSLSGSK